MPGFDSLQGLGQGAGIASGLAQGMQAFVNTRSALQEEAIKKKLANAQSIEAYGKLVPAIGRTRATGIAENMGLIPSGMIPQQPAQQTPQPESHSPSGLAPTGGLPLDDSGKTSSGNSPAQTSNQAFTDSLSDMDEPSRNVAMFEHQKQFEQDQKRQQALWEQQQPAAKATLANELAKPTTSFHDLIKDDAAKTQAAAKNTKDIFDILDEGGTRSKQAVMELLPEVFHPGNPRAGDIPTQFAKGSKAREEIADYVAGKTTGEFSPETADAIKQMTARLYKNQAQTYQGKVNAVSGAYPGADKSVAAVPEMDVMNKHLAGLAKAKGQEESPRGLMSAPANASSPKGLMPDVDSVEQRLRARGIKF